ncbi:uncharacterized protein B0J16DRAFT_9913 [Fusarium flagelliforme]|uniref:uncharacterized protein n=1 Tax=Fusarium flagelliforme TaxID=2675880 RepID=UPI001E8D509E|nr:uncharacterized protein B0J16DRAFT_9913 [Fusarium flagelliforme]KAH7196966.1 hypothetical protein B0J16DRAFT_9913 [Fusarium flagelliforme]
MKNNLLRLKLLTCCCLIAFLFLYLWQVVYLGKCCVFSRDRSLRQGSRSKARGRELMRECRKSTDSTMGPRMWLWREECRTQGTRRKEGIQVGQKKGNKCVSVI